MTLVLLALMAQSDPLADEAVVPPPSAATETSVGLHAGLHVALPMIDVTASPVYGFASAALGMALITNGGWNVSTVGLGWTLGLGAPAETMWMLDVFAMASAGAVRARGSVAQPFGVVGLGVGFRFLHRSGFTLGFKLPLAGAAIAPFTQSPGDAVGWFYFVSVASMPLASLGWRF